MKNFIKTLIIIAASFLITSCMSHKSDTDDWPQYRNDEGRTGYTPLILSDRLSPSWICHFSPPDLSWTGIHTRMTFDYAYQPVISGNTVFIGSSNDCKIYALNRKTGKIVWSFFTDGPVRFAPLIYKNKVYAVSDDGYLYCLSARNGKLLWKSSGSEQQDMIIGNDRMISRWPARGGPVIKDGILYFGAGIWPSEKIYIYAIDPDNGEVLWVNNSSGELEMPQPHGGAVAESGISAQGYLSIGGDKLFVPTGRAVPAALNLKSGELEYFHLQLYRNYGGSEIMSTDPFLFVPGGNSRDMDEIRGTKCAVFNTNDGSIISGEINSEAIAIAPDFLYCVNNETHQVEAYQTENLVVSNEIQDRKGELVQVTSLTDPVWKTDIINDYVKTLIVSGNRLIAGTATEKILIINREDGKLISSFKVNGIPYGLAAAHGSLFVSTNKGTLYCFDEGVTASPVIYFNDMQSFTHVPDETFVSAAEEIISMSGLKNGYCLDLECGDGSLIYELIKKTNLTVIGLEKDKNKVESARKIFSDAGIYGSRVVIYHGDINTIPLPDYFANLIVSQQSLTSGSPDNLALNIQRCQRPYGGVVITGKKGEMKMDIRGELQGAGQWTHQYHDPANTTISEDEIVDGKLEVLWFRDSDFDMPSRHGRGVAPLFKDGRLFVEGNNSIRAVDAYNGHLLWEYYIEDLMLAYDQEHISGTAITHGNWCIEDDRLYVRRGLSSYNRAAKNCYVLDAKTGSEIKVFTAPRDHWDAPHGYWGYIAVKNGILFGTVANEEHIVKWGWKESDMNNQFSESNSIFAIDVSSGEMLWEYKAKHSIRHNSIAIGNDKVYFIDRPIAEIDYIYSRRGESAIHPPGILTALDAKTGKVLMRNTDNIWGTLLILSEKYNKLLMSYSDTRYRLPSETGGKIAVLDATTGKKIWEAETRKNLPPDYSSSSRSRPLVNDSIIFIEPETFDLFTGKIIDNNFERSYGCGIISGSKNMLFFRSATLGYYLFDDNAAGVQNYGGIRPGCWINIIPAGGLVLMPDATNRCDCSYLMKSWIALQPM